jgi:hypothetical protein
MDTHVLIPFLPPPSSHTLTALLYYTLLPATPVGYTILLVVFLTSGHSFPSCPLLIHSPALQYSTTLSTLLHQWVSPFSLEFPLLMDTHVLIPFLPPPSSHTLTALLYYTLLPATPVGYTILPIVSPTSGHSFPSCPLPLPMHSQAL